MAYLDKLKPIGQQTLGGSSTQMTTPQSGGYVSKLSSISPNETKPESEAKGGLAGELLTGSTQKFGKTIGESYAAPKNAELHKGALESHTQLTNMLTNKLSEANKTGQDTTRLKKVLAEHIKTTPKLEDFTGDVINKTAGEVIGEGIGTGLEALSGGSLSSGVKTVASKTLSTAAKLRQGAGIGTAYGAIGGGSQAMQEGGGVGDTVKGALIGAGTGAAIGGGLGYAGGKIASGIAGSTDKRASQLGKITGEVLQGEVADTRVGQKVLSNLNVENVKTYEDLSTALDKKVKSLSNEQDRLLGTKKDTLPLGKLNATLNVGDKKIKYNFVKDALNQIQDFYTKTNDRVGLEEVKQLITKASKKGLTVQEINELARLHGQKLNAYNASGELASGLSKQAAENTRAGLKTTVRELFGGTKSKAIDQSIADTIRTRDLIKDVASKVNTLQQKIQNRSLGAKAGYAIGKVINLLGLGSPKGIVEALIPRGQGFKVMNALDLEKQLSKNLKLIQELSDESLPEETLIKKANDFLMRAATKPIGK